MPRALVLVVHDHHDGSHRVVDDFLSPPLPLSPGFDLENCPDQARAETNNQPDETKRLIALRHDSAPRDRLAVQARVFAEVDARAVIQHADPADTA